MTGRRPKVLPSGTHQMLEHPSIRLFTAMSCVRDVNDTIPVGGPCGLIFSQAVTRLGNALLRIALETLAVKA